MILYGFLLAVAFLPNTVGGALAPRFIVAGVGAWALTLATAPPRLSARRAWPLLAFVLWVMLSAYWAPSRLDAINSLLDLFIAVSLFVLGAAIEDGEGLYVGLGVGAPFAMVFGLFDPNFDMAGEAAATAAVGLGAIGHPLAIIAALCVLLGHSRGGFLGLIVGYAVLLAVICRHGWCRWLAVAIICLLGGFLGYRVWFEPHGSLWERWAVWQDVWAGTSWLGNGLGSIWTVFPYYATHQDVVMSAAVQHAHNDFLEILFEQGYIGGSLAAIATGALLYQRYRTVEGAVLISILAMGMVGFPLHVPVTLVVASFACGRLCRRDGLRDISWAGRIPSLAFIPFRRSPNHGNQRGEGGSGNHALGLVCEAWGPSRGASGGHQGADKT